MDRQMQAAILRARPWIFQRSTDIYRNASRPSLFNWRIVSSVSTELFRRFTANGSSASLEVTCSINRYREASKIATIAVNNPAKLNIVNSTVLLKLREACKSLRSDNDLRAVILTGQSPDPGKPPAFIGGADIKEMIQISTPDKGREFICRIHDVCSALRDLPVPVIAKIHGLCLGAGLEIAAACDLRVCTDTSTFGMPEVNVGIPSVVEAALLPSLIGMGRTRRLCYLAENISAAEAYRWGLVEQVVKDNDNLDQLVDEWSRRIADMAPGAIRSQKALALTWERSTIDESINAGIEHFAESFKDGGQEPKEFMNRFINRKRA